ncbi:hypothetical protein DM02DRAFT_399933 [Periconia macrospinosa]|uniref:Uncharacterized protein n=1 Tax=Periconia macrospinosa TaxID=97972 RepID=A0A2V1CYN0_9PLEO|nr:hypothetical protein DM02DRAFT_399933 [Periconia macrospinosa]
MILTGSRLTKIPEDFFINVLAVTRGQFIQVLYDGQLSAIHEPVVYLLITLLYVIGIPDGFFLDALKACQHSLIEDIDKGTFEKVGRTLNIMKWLLSKSKLPHYCFVKVIAPIREKLVQKINDENIAKSSKRRTFGFVIELSSRLTILDIGRVLCLSIKASGQPTSDTLEGRMKISAHTLGSCGFGFFCPGRAGLFFYSGGLFLPSLDCQLCSRFEFLPAFEAACFETYTAAEIRSSFHFARLFLPQNLSGFASAGAYPSQ